MTRQLKFGVGHDFRNLNPARRTFVEVYAQSLERIAYAEQLGFDYLFLSEHHFTADGHAPSLFPILGAVAARTTRIRLNTYVFLLPLHHPLHVAEDITALDILSNGRMELGVGLGYRSEEFDAFGVDRHRRGSLMDESCEILLKAWTEDNWSYEGRHFRLHDITVVPRPVQQPHPRLWISARNERAARRAARLRAPLMIAPAPYTEDVRQVYRAYADALRIQGEDPAGYDVMGSFTVHVLAPGEAPPTSAGADHRRRQYVDWYGKDGDLPNEAARIADPPPYLQEQIGVTGDPATCIAAINRMLDEVPFTTLFVTGLAPVQMERFAREIAPHFRP